MGITIDWTIMRPLRHRPPLDAAVASLGLLLTLQGLAVIIFGAQEKVFPAAVPLRFVSVAGFNFSYPQLLGFGCVAVAAALIGVLFKWTRAGTAIRAYVENPESARGLGVSPLYVSTIAWSMAALLAALAGVMLAPLTLLDSLLMFGTGGQVAAFLDAASGDVAINDALWAARALIGDGGRLQGSPKKLDITAAAMRAQARMTVAQKKQIAHKHVQRARKAKLRHQIRRPAHENHISSVPAD